MEDDKDDKDFKLVADFGDFGSLLVVDINDLFDEEHLEISAFSVGRA